jgi:proteasome lid subunit RPN8/RPN11
MKQTDLIIPRRMVQQIFHQAQETPSLEVCGLVGALNGEPRSAYPVPNIARDPQHLFDMDPQARKDAEQRMQKQGESLFAIYQSHPDTPPEPTADDVKAFREPALYYLIISLNTKGVLEMRAWRSEKGALRETPLRIIPPEK